MLLSERLQLLHEVLAEVGVQVHVRLQHADVRPNLQCSTPMSHPLLLHTHVTLAHAGPPYNKCGVHVDSYRACNEALMLLNIDAHGIRPLQPQCNTPFLQAPTPLRTSAHQRRPPGCSASAPSA